MKRLITPCLITLALLALQSSVKAQTSPDYAVPEPSRRSLLEVERIPVPDNPNSQSFPPRREDQVIGKGILAPVENDVAQYQFLLSQKKTGLMRLLPREHFDWEVYQVDKKVNLRGGGAYFSFFYRTHEYGWGSDLSFERGNLSVGFAGTDYGFLTDIGDMALESIFAQDPKAEFLVNYQPPEKEQEARLEARKFSTITARGVGISVDGVSYQNRLSAEVNHTYLLRSIVYDRSDVVVAFRVVSKSDDGALTIAWKILHQFTPPTLARNATSRRN